MPKFLAECASVGDLDAAGWAALAQRFNEAADLLAGRAQWVHSYVTDDALVFVYIADEPATVTDHTRSSGLTCERITEIRTTIDPSTAEALA